MTPVSQPSVDLALPFDAGFARGLLIYLRRLGSYGSFLAANLVALAIFYLFARFPNTTQIVLLLVCVAYFVWLVPRSTKRFIARRGVPVHGRDDVILQNAAGSYFRNAVTAEEARALADAMYKEVIEAEEKLRREEIRVKAAIDKYESETRARIQKEIEIAQREKVRSIRAWPEEVRARLDLFHHFEKIGVLPVWSATGETTFVRVPANYNWNEFYESFVLGEASARLVSEAWYVKPPPILKEVTSQSFLHLRLACLLIADSTRSKRPLPEYIWDDLHVLGGVRIDSASLRVEGHDAIFCVWVRVDMDREVLVWVRVVTTDSLAETDAVERKLMEAMRIEPGVLKKGGILELGPTALAVIGESARDVYTIPRIVP